MKKIVSILLAIILVFFIVACGDSKDVTRTDESAAEQTRTKQNIRESRARDTSEKTSTTTPTMTTSKTTSIISLEKPEYHESPDGDFLKADLVGKYINGYHLRPKEIRKKGVVAIFGGSEGSCNMYTAIKLANQGYEVYPMYFFGQENQRAEIARIPLEFFEELYIVIQNNSVTSKPLTVIGASRGAELTLILASKYPDLIGNIVLFAPSAYAFGGVTDDTGKELSPWTYEDEELPFLKQSDLFRDEAGRSIVEKSTIKTPMVLEPIFTYLIEKGENAERAMIDISSVKANILLFAGKDDQMWPSYKMGQKIIEEHQGNNELVAYDSVGHSFLGPTEYNNMAMGGEYENNVRAGIDSDKILLERLEEWNK